MTRQEHLALAKMKALARLHEAETSPYHETVRLFVVDLMEHPETRGHPGLDKGLELYESGMLYKVERIREWIESFR